MGSNNPNHLKVGDNSHSKMLFTVKTMVGDFGLTHPCPYCRYHFLNPVSRSDADWQDVGQNITVTGVVNGSVNLCHSRNCIPWNICSRVVVWEKSFRQLLTDCLYNALLLEDS